ncbi:ATP-dependent helicase, partial [Poseidonibacter ostreae]
MTLKKPIKLADVIREKEKYTKNRKIKTQKKEVNLLDTLNPEQLKAVIAKEKNVLVVASAGTGKTSTIIGRVITLLKQGILPSEIILLTFTSKAGKEMLARLGKYFNQSIVSQIFAGTFHSYGMLLLKQSKINRKIKKPKEIKLFFESIMESKKFTDELSAERYAPSTILEYVGLYENTNVGESFKQWLTNKFEEKKENTSDKKAKEKIDKNIEMTNVYQDIYDEFCSSKKANKICDFNDLLKMVLYHFSVNENTLKTIIVDEYQDTNNFQNKILKQLEGSGSSIFAVGDYDQSIYAFNGSNVYLIKDFVKNYGGSENVGIYSLCRNYRSSKQICTIANNCIINNERIVPKELVPMKEGNFSVPMVLKNKNKEEQAEKIVDIIKESQYNLNDIAVLFRTNNSANLIEPILIQNNIPTIRAKSGSFFDGEDITILIAVFRILVGKEKSIMEFLMLSKFIIGMSKDECKLLFEMKSAHENIHGALREFSDKLQSNTIISEINLPSWHKFCELAEDIKGILNVGTIFKLIYETDSYAKMFDTCVEKSSKFARGKEKEEVISQIEKKHELLIEIANSSDSISNFLLKTTFSSKDDEEEHGVNLMTVHASKGLEFKQVFVVDLVEDDFPNHKLANGGGGIDEERRLFYVAVTRAEEELYLSYYTDAEKKTPIRSRFISECKIA